MRAILMAGVAVLLTAGVAGAADVPLPPDTIIAARQAGYDLQQGIAAQMKAVVEGGGSVKTLTDAAKGMVAWGKVIPSLFPAGTETGHGTKAKPEVWSDQAGFAKAADNYVQAATKLLTLAEADDAAGFAEQFKVTAGACVACHRQFRNR